MIRLGDVVNRRKSTREKNMHRYRDTDPCSIIAANAAAIIDHHFMILASFLR